jgi:DNA-binding LacI/PurR family transcriptional regulator
VGEFNPHSMSPVTEHLVEAMHRHTLDQGRTLQVRMVPDLKHCNIRELVGDAQGVILRTSNIHNVNREITQMLEGIPAVQVLGETWHGRHWVDLITPDNGQAGAIAAEYLIEEGCNPLVFATTELAGQVLRKRCEAFVRMARAAGKEVHVFFGTPEERVPVWLEEMCGVSATFQRSVDRADLVQKLVSLPAGPMGLFVPMDLELSSMLPQLQHAGLDVRSSVKAIGCDRESRCFSGLDPVPATLDLHIDNLAHRTIRRLLYRIKHPEEPLVRITVSPSLVRPEELVAEWSAYQKMETKFETLTVSGD